MCKQSETKKVEPSLDTVVDTVVDSDVLIAVVVSVAVVILLLLLLLLFCFIRNRKQRKIIEGIRKSESIDENPDYGIYRDGCVEYSTVTDKNSKFETE